MHAVTHVEMHLYFEEGGVLGTVVVLHRKWYWCGDNVQHSYCQCRCLAMLPHALLLRPPRSMDRQPRATPAPA
jgi:hypothetical protein